MVIFGGLEIIAAGYVLNELGKDGDKAKQNAERQRRRRHHHHHHHQDDSDIRHRPQRPAQQSLAPPIVGPPRPNSAPPIQPFQHAPSRPGPWQNSSQPHIQHQQSFPVQRPPNSQTWPQQPGGGPMFRPHDFPANPHSAMRPPTQNQTPPPPYSQQPPPPGPGHLQPRPTMHYDMKTGKWQSDMLPPEMPRSNSMPVDNSSASQSRPRSASTQPPPSGLRRGQRAYSSGSWSSSASDSDSDDEDLAYGSLPGKKNHYGGSSSGLAPPSTAMSKVTSHERQRPQQSHYQQPQEMHGQSSQPARPVERDWYADQKHSRRQENKGPYEMEQPMRYELP